ncbi:MAG: DNA polymerase III subunit gamma/tau [Oscillospiraceae bacterium]|nr:DNA polymerase III subunit gamma/tau [Oscillospiraceae bacterium]
MYQALYRKYRPLSFDDVVSQPQVTQTLKNQLVNGNTAHAYLFTGSRGTGKTTCARILAKAMNCLHPVNGNPCLECEICRDADAGALGDIIEIDAASNSSVDDIRDLREGTIYTPERCKYKVYIIDEVHMLSPSAVNALLKIMEEPPSHVKFILATTEVHKVLPTILSRCQRFNFRRILPEDIRDRLLYVAEKENISLDSDAAELIAKTADGGMRDALSLLDQCVAFSDRITAEVVANAAGIAGRDYLFGIIEAVIDRNAAKAVTIVKELHELSKDMQKLCDELIAQFRNIMIAKTVPGSTDALVCMPSEIEIIKKFADSMTIEDIFAVLDTLQKSNERIARVSAKRVEIEMCLIKLCSAQTYQSGAAIDNSEIYAKIDMLEKKLAAAPAASAMNRAPVQEPYRRSSEGKTPAESPKTAVASEQQVSDFQKLNPADFKPVEQWAEILEEFTVLCPSGSGALTGSYALENQGYMLVYSENSFFMNVLRNKDNANKLMEAVVKITGKAYQIRAKCTAKKEVSESPVEALLKKAHDNGIPTESDK